MSVNCCFLREENQKIVYFCRLIFNLMLNKIIPDYYTTKDNIIFYLIFVFFFSLGFVNLFTPFQGAWYNVQHYTRAQLFTDTLIIVAGGTLILAVSRTILYYAHKKKPINYLQYFAWMVVEVFFIALLYAVIVRYVVEDVRDFSDIFTRAVIFVPTIIVIPTIISHLYISSRYKDEKIEELESRQEQAKSVTTPPQDEEFAISEEFSGDEFILDNHLTSPTEPQHTDIQPSENQKSEVATEPQPSPSSRIINFFDEKDELQLSLRPDHIYFLESAENYVNIYYRNKENTERFTLRSSLKKQQEKLEKYGFIRCHRSYLVNFDNILLLRKDKNGPYLDFGAPNLPQIPVSKTYLDAVTAYFISNSED